MTVFDPQARASAARPMTAYFGVLLAIVLIMAGAAAIWVTTDNSGTNALSGDPLSTSPPAPVTTPQP